MFRSIENVFFHPSLKFPIFYPSWFQTRIRLGTYSRPCTCMHPHIRGSYAEAHQTWIHKIDVAVFSTAPRYYFCCFGSYKRPVQSWIHQSAIQSITSMRVLVKIHISDVHISVRNGLENILAEQINSAVSWSTYPTLNECYKPNKEERKRKEITIF